MSASAGVRVRTALLAAAVALAFADASIVVLALPAIYGELDTTIVGVSWVITTYALVVGSAGAVLALVGRRRLPPGPLLTVGMVLFAGASVACGLAGSMTWLIGGRIGQGLGATLLLSGALGAFEAHLGPERGRWSWSLAATIGLAIGPALGGVLTELFDWRAIFLAQAPVAVAALLAGAARPVAADATSAATTASPPIAAGPPPPAGVPLSPPTATPPTSPPLAPSGAATSPPIAAPAPPQPTGDRLDPSAAPATALGSVRRATSVRTGTSWLADAALVLVSGALVGALFLGVLLVIEVWRYSPISGALVVSALPAAVFVVRPLRHITPGWVGALTGCLALAAGLGALGYLPAASAGWAAVALAACGAGFGLVDPVVGDLAESSGPDAVRAGARTVAARHLGLVLGLVVIAPALATDLEVGAERAVIAGADVMLDTRLELRNKIRVARAVSDVVEETPRGQMPSVDRAFVKAGVEGDDADVASADLLGRVEDVLTRSFRRVFLLAALLALLGAVPATLAAVLSRPARAGPSDATTDATAAAASAARRRRPVPTWAGALAAVAVLGASIGVLVAESNNDAGDYGEVIEEDACRSGNDPYPGRGLDPTIQRIALGALNGAACDLGVSRERLILSLADVPGVEGVDFDDDERDAAIKAGLVRAIDDADERGSLPGWAASGLRFLARRAPVRWVVEGIDLGDIPGIGRFLD